VERTRREIARAIVVSGYVLLGLAAIISFANQVNGELGTNVRANLQLFALPLASLAGILAWWFLTKLEANDSVQLSLLRKGYLALGVQSLLGSITYFIIVSSIVTSTSWEDLVFWFYALGTVTVGLGFLFMTLSVRAPASFDETASRDDGPINTAVDA
jgi:hypothetical protein